MNNQNGREIITINKSILSGYVDGTSSLYLSLLVVLYSVYSFIIRFLSVEYIQNIYVCMFFALFCTISISLVVVLEFKKLQVRFCRFFFMGAFFCLYVVLNFLKDDQVLRQSEIIAAILLSCGFAINYKKSQIINAVQLLIRINLLVTLVAIGLFMVLDNSINPPNRILSFLISLERNSLQFQRVGEAGFVFLILMLFSVYVQQRITIIYIFVFGLGLLISDSRTALVLALFSFIVISAKCWLFMTRVSLISVVALFSILTILWVKYEKIYALVSTLINRMGERDIFNGRLFLFKKVLNGFINNFNLNTAMIGIDSYEGWIRELGIDWQLTSHSFFIDSLVRGGIPYFLCVIFIFVYLGIAIIRKDKGSSSDWLMSISYFVFLSYLFFEPEYMVFGVSVISLVPLLFYHYATAKD
ncbi:MAG: O-antigen ligase family protein [bacterium]